MRVLSGVVVLTTLVALLAGGGVLWSTTSELVQGSELDQAGRQRRLSERIALDVELLRADPTRQDVRDELEVAAATLRSIRIGLLEGDELLDLDGRVPNEFRRLYSSAGLDLTNRLRRFESAGASIAQERGPVDESTASVVVAEAAGQRLVADLDVAVASLASSQAHHSSSRTRIAIGGLLTSALLGLGALLAVLFVRRRINREAAERNALATEVADSEELYRTTVNALVDGVIIQDETLAVIDINDAARRTITAHFDGALPQEGQTLIDALPQMIGEDLQPLSAHERPAVRALAGPDPVVGSVVGLSRGGDVAWFRCNATSFEQRQGRGRRVVLTFADITLEREMARQLSLQEQRFRLALEHAPIGMALVSIDGTFLTVNGALCELTGHSNEELIERGLFGLDHTGERPYSRQDFDRLVADDVDTTSSEHSIITSDGATIDVRIAVSVIRPDDGADPYFIVELLDITQARRAAAAQEVALAIEQEAVSELMALDDARSTFMSTISHELRTPLTSLVGYLELLEDGAAGPLTDEQQHMVSAGVRNGNRLGLLIDDLLTLTAAERSDESSRNDRVDVDSLIDGVMETMAPLAQAADVTLRRSAEASAEAAVLGDRSELERVLINIVGNAVKFTPIGGSIDVNATCEVESDPCLVISVTDTGMGIPKDEQRHLFTKFFRSVGAQRNHIQGTGLGLAIVARIVEAHDGQIDVTSVEQVGTTVTIRLPLAVSLTSA